MTILDKYLLRETYRYFFIVLTMVIAIYLAVDFFEKIDNFMEAKLPFSRAVDFFLNSIPFVFSQIIPVGILLAILISFGMMNKHNELIALRSCGLSVYRLIKPILALGFMFTIILFFLLEAIVPVTIIKANHIWLYEVRKIQATTTTDKNIWIKSKNAIINIRHYDLVEKTIHRVTMNTFDDQFRLTSRLDAEKGVFLNGQWILYEILEQRLDDMESGYTILYHDTMPVELDMSPEKLKQVTKNSSEMNIKELYEYIQTIEMEGYSSTRFLVDFHAKISFPFVCVIMVVAGIGIACKNQLKDGLPSSIAYGIGAAFLYWVLHSFCISLGYGEMLPPVIAAWSTNAIFLSIGIILLIKADQI